MTELTELCSDIENRMSNYPEGKIHVVTRNNNTQYYLRASSQDKSGSYISKKEKNKIHIYLQKKYDEEVYRLAMVEKQSLERLLKKVNNSDIKLKAAYSKNPEEVKKIIQPIDFLDDDFISKWRELSYEIKPVEEGCAILISDNGEAVRSKSELNIANSLKKYGIEYKYEKPLKLYNGIIIHPDFTLLDVKNRQEIYWEHRGMMDNPEYARHSVYRIKQMNRSGIIVGKNLIITEETQSSALGTDEIERIILRFKRAYKS